MSSPEYPEYKESSVEWLGPIPAHWDYAQTGRYFDVSMGQTILKEDLTDVGVPVFSATEGDHYFGYLDSPKVILNPGDIVVPARGNSIGSVKIVKEISTCTQTTIYCKHRADKIVPEYSYYFMNGLREYLFDFTQTAIPQITTEQVKRNPILLPPVHEQFTIAAFLDRETAKIDALVAEQETLIELLKEKRQAVISHAVTKGLDPNVPMKDSGVEWLGEVPEHWAVVRIKSLIQSIEQGWSPQCENFPVSTDEEWGVLKVGCVNGGVFNPLENKCLPEEFAPREAITLLAGDLLISRANTRELVGSAAAVNEGQPRLMLCDKLYRLRLNDSCMPAFIAQLLGTSYARSKIETVATGASSSMLNIGQSVILDMPVPVPDKQEQLDILAVLEAECERIDCLSSEVQNAIDLLKERRSALISAAVTGKIDVRGLAEAI